MCSVVGCVRGWVSKITMATESIPIFLIKLYALAKALNWPNLGNIKLNVVVNQ